ncbi:Alpha/Beta hydrolase protein [Gloeopeniophorella convolvens]|nr:Alpha/Beta hydrolase protein [Gloeopeniophorella convolvens]
MVHEFRSQPLKTLYLTFEMATTLFVRLPFWLVIYMMSRSFRPRKSWSLKKAILIKLVQRVHFTTVRTDSLLFFGDHLTVTEGLDIKHVWVSPTPHLLTEELKMWAAAANVAPARIPGYWIDKEGADIPIGAPLEPGETVVLALHGGAYVRLSASPRDVSAHIARGLLAHCPSVRRVFALEYRLSRTAPDAPANAFPAALFDALAGYVHVLSTLRAPPARVLVVGDSAGAHLALALVRLLVEHAGAVPGLPPPPGGAEMLVDQIGRLVDCMRRDMGEGGVRYYEAQDGVHDFVMLPFCEPERTLALCAIADWLEERPGYGTERAWPEKGFE